MHKAVSTGLLARNIFSRAVSYRFCVGWAPLDPRKHTTMTHNNNNMYLDLWEFGQYPDWIHITSVPARTYQPQLLTTLAAALNTLYVPPLTPRTKTSPPNTSSHTNTESGTASSPKTSKSTRSSIKYTPPYSEN
jgi:hypothetical protein